MSNKCSTMLLCIHRDKIRPLSLVWPLSRLSRSWNVIEDKTRSNFPITKTTLKTESSTGPGLTASYCSSTCWFPPGRANCSPKSLLGNRLDSSSSFLSVASKGLEKKLFVGSYNIWNHLPEVGIQHEMLQEMVVKVAEKHLLIGWPSSGKRTWLRERLF